MSNTPENPKLSKKKAQLSEQEMIDELESNGIRVIVKPVALFEDKEISVQDAYRKMKNRIVYAHALNPDPFSIVPYVGHA